MQNQVPVSQNRPVTGRFAPSPSGRLHLGNLACSLLAWLSAKSQGGRIVLRIEDLDAERCPRVYADLLEQDLAWLGLTWDEGGSTGGAHAPYYQSECGDIYTQSYRKLEQRGLVYPCFCSRSQLHAASAPHTSDGNVIYPGTCRGLTPEEIAEKRKKKAPAYRLMVPDEEITFADGCMGTHTENLLRDCGDFYLRRADGVFAYQLAVVVDDAAMMDLVGTIKEHGVMTPATVRPEKDGTGYEIIAGHRRCRGSELAGVEELPCIVRDMTDVEAVREMKNSNKQRGDPLPSELAKLLDLEVEAIKHQGGRLDGVAPGDVGKRSVEIVGEAHDMNYKKVMRYLRLNFLVPELLSKVDEKGLGFMPAVEISYIKPKNQRLIAVSIDGEQSSPSHAQAKRLRELDQAGKLNGDVIDGILSEKKKEDRGVIISMAELEKYFGKEVTPVKMKEQIMSLLDEWKEKQPPELKKPEKKADLEK